MGSKVYRFNESISFRKEAFGGIIFDRSTGFLLQVNDSGYLTLKLAEVAGRNGITLSELNEILIQEYGSLDCTRAKLQQFLNHLVHHSVLRVDLSINREVQLFIQKRTENFILWPCTLQSDRIR